jgi:hypothetical protein
MKRPPLQYLPVTEETRHTCAIVLLTDTRKTDATGDRRFTVEVLYECEPDTAAVWLVGFHETGSLPVGSVATIWPRGEPLPSSWRLVKPRQKQAA